MVKNLFLTQKKDRVIEIILLWNLFLMKKITLIAWFVATKIILPFGEFSISILSQLNKEHDKQAKNNH